MKSLLELNEELENYFNNTIIPQLFVDSDLVLRKYTPPAMKQFTLKQEHIGVSIEDIKDNFRYPNIVENIKYVIATGKILEKEIQTTDLRWFQMNILPYHVRSTNKTNGVIITFVDITSRIKDLREHEKLVAEYELLLDTIAHDVKNSILVLELGTQALNMSNITDENRSMLLSNMTRSVQEIKKVIHGMAGSHWQKEKYHASQELLDLQNIIEDVRLALAPQILESGAIIQQEIGVSELKFVRRKLRSVLYNLVSNAIKYTPADRRPEIKITSYIDNGFFVISVADNGIGISNEEQTKMFEKFSRTKTDIEGSGVGLYLVNTIVTNGGGRIWVDSESGKGSVFKVFLKLE